MLCSASFSRQNLCNLAIMSNAKPSEPARESNHLTSASCTKRSQKGQLFLLESFRSTSPFRYLHLCKNILPYGVLLQSFQIKIFVSEHITGVFFSIPSPNPEYPKKAKQRRHSTCNRLLYSQISLPFTFPLSLFSRTSMRRFWTRIVLRIFLHLSLLTPFKFCPNIFRSPCINTECDYNLWLPRFTELSTRFGTCV